MDDVQRPPARSTGSLKQRRVQLPWPASRPFRILSIDGGGIRGIFPATVLSEFERRHLGGRSIADYFDLIAGTSTGGILALGLGAGLKASEMVDLYVKRGREIFPPPAKGLWGAVTSFWHSARNAIFYRYDRSALERALTDVLGPRTLGTATTRLCIPSFEGSYGEVYIYKTPHHPDFHLDGARPMVQVGLATAAAPTFFLPLAQQGHLMVDGGVWANNPIMVGLVDALSCFDVPRHQVHVLSIGCGESDYRFGKRKLNASGTLTWLDLVFTTMRLQSQNALGQSRLLVGAENVIRIDPPELRPAIAMDDWLRATELLPAHAVAMAERFATVVSQRFFHGLAEPTNPSASDRM